MLNFFKKSKNKKDAPHQPTRLQEARNTYNYMLEQKRCYSNRYFVNKRYEEFTGRLPNIDNPTLLTEKIQWIKLHYNNPLYAKCADKYAVRAYVESKGYGHILNDLIGVYTRAEDIHLEKLPNKFVLKATHGCAWNYLCRNKSEEILQWEDTKLLLEEWLKQDFSIFSRELHYGYIPPRIICEQFLETADGHDLKDYRIHCFHGEPKMIQVEYGRFTKHERNYYDLDWSLIELRWGTPTPNPDINDRPPANLAEMLEVSRALSADFGYVRVDLYNVEGKIVFGELTLTPLSGFGKPEPEEMDAEMGSWWTLPMESEYVIK